MSHRNGERGIEGAQATLLRKIAGAVVVLSLAVGCRVPPPTVTQGLKYGFNSPEQTLASFRTAVQGNLLEEEHRCFSVGFKRRTGLKALNAYDLARDEVTSRVPQLRWALYRAEDPEILALTKLDALLQCRIPGPFWFKDRYLVFRMRREGFWKGWTEASPDKPTEGNTMPNPITARVLEYVEHDDRMRLNIDEFSYWTDDTAPEAITALQGGWQWKIEDFNVYDEPVSPDQFEEPARLSIPVSPRTRQ